eukprot:TRINITY_DN3001_c0_g1_i1.p1 TRINITY_DN3001_c0_g1~~TRINITY_DN3001_c0_g1_i1.p1  ORF type:complete len:138 (+),score=50.27 TRINITY_DN3001_c0_g1_i1:64-477(+)
MSGEVEDVFRVFAKDQKTAEPSLLGTCVRALGKNPSEKEVQEWIKELGGKRFDVETLKKYAAKKAPKPIDQEREMREAFKVLDASGKGTILEAELRQILCNLGEALRTEEVDLLLRGLTIEADGTIAYDAFVDMLVS